jgi:hypothetical protein
LYTYVQLDFGTEHIHNFPSCDLAVLSQLGQHSTTRHFRMLLTSCIALNSCRELNYANSSSSSKALDTDI